MFKSIIQLFSQNSKIKEQRKRSNLFLFFNINNFDLKDVTVSLR